jgi:hypothetical protein
MSFKLKNNASSIVANNPLAVGGLTLNVAGGEGANFPTTGNFRLTIWNADTYANPGDDPDMEIVECTSRSVDALTIIRAREGTSDKEHVYGLKVALLLTSGIFDDSTQGIYNTFVEDSDFDEQSILVSITDNSPVPLTVTEDSVIGRKTGENIAALSATDVRDIVNVEDGADVTDTTNVDDAGAVMHSDIVEDNGFLYKTGVETYEAIKSNLGAGVVPNVNDDSGSGYAVGSRWIDTIGNTEYVCIDSTLGAAIWMNTTTTVSTTQGLTDLFRHYCAQVYGWCGGGNTGSVSDVIDRITLTNDTTNGSDRCNLSIARYGLGSLTNNIYGWFGGGDSGAVSIKVDRITLADDTTNAIDRCDLSVARRYLAAFTNDIYGWFGGGWADTYSNVIDRITLATDVNNAIDTCDISIARYGLGCFTDNTYGFFAGGDSGSISNVIDRMELNDDTINAIDRCDLSVARRHLVSFTDYIYGWFCGGYTTSSSSIIDRMELHIDTTNAVDRCNLTIARYSPCGFSDHLYGWICGGYDSAVSNIVDRITIANDTANAIDKCDLTVARYGLSGFTGR